MIKTFMKIKLLFLCFLFLSQVALAQNQENLLNNENIGSAIGKLYAKNGEITKEDYDGFWNEVGVTDKAGKEKIINFIKNDLLLMQDYQKATWQCAEQAWNTQKVPACPNLHKKYNLIQSKFDKKKAQNQLTDIKKFSDNIIAAAAKRSSLKTENGEMPLSLDMIKMTKENMDKIFARFEAILKTDYIKT